jgi:hypothetical protein
MIKFHKENWLNLNFEFIIFFVISYTVSSFYLYGDQYHYALNYKEMQNLDLISGFHSYQKNLSSSEPVYFFLTYLFSNLGISKLFFCSLANCILYATLKKYFYKIKLNCVIAYLILYTNFYLLVLYFSADRLKISFIFLLLFFVSTSRIRNTYLILSVLAHSQSIILLICTYLPSFRRIVVDRNLNRQKIIINIFIFGLILFFMWEHISNKLSTYYSIFKDRNDIFEYWKLTVFFIFSLYLSSKKYIVILIFLPIFAALFLVGPDRVNMIGYIVMMYFATLVNGGVNFPLLATTLYFGIKGIFFYWTIYTYGDGFYDTNFIDYLILNFLL